ncbi:Uncharacterised protein [Bordetella pseudohinzii]|uniref:Uncharacterized protein n=1 Tax=Bordetella pseudohinzii TaxID=1331258 RepID=A0A0M7I994_9BORD|nr:Uncharacterised protein [Bordetella pseudohinzii]
MAAGLDQGLEHIARDKQPAAHGQQDGQRHQHQGHRIGLLVRGFGFVDIDIGDRVHIARIGLHGRVELCVLRRRRGRELHVFRNGLARHRVLQALEDFHIGLELGQDRRGLFFHVGRLGRLGEDLETLGRLGQGVAGPLGLLFELPQPAFLQVGDGVVHIDARAQRIGIAGIARHHLIREDTIDFIQARIAGVHAQPTGGVGYQHRQEEEPEHQDHAGTDFQIRKHAISALYRNRAPRGEREGLSIEVWEAGPYLFMENRLEPMILEKDDDAACKATCRSSSSVVVE